MDSDHTFGFLHDNTDQLIHDIKLFSSVLLKV